MLPKKMIVQKLAISLSLLASAFLSCASIVPAQAQSTGLANATVIVIRHAEKPATGAILSPAGMERAKKYAEYFHPLRLDGTELEMNALFAGADTEGSLRPRLTLEPLSKAIGVPLRATFSTKDPAELVHTLETERHGDHILIAWRHKRIPALLNALGAQPATLLPNGSWPNLVYDWLIVLHFDAAGRLDRQERIQEPDPLP